MTTAEGLRIHLPVFEGPLDLLFFLIRKHELDISEISLASIADEFVTYVESDRELDLAEAGIFIAPAATLMYLKSKWLLPPDETSGEPVEQEEEAEKLIHRLEDYQTLRDFAQSLAGLEGRARASFPRPLTTELARRLEEIAESEPHVDMTTFELLKAIKRVQEFAFPIPRDVIRDEIPLEEKVRELTGIVRDQVRVSLSTLLKSSRSLLEAVVFFLAALELSKQRFLRISQEGNFEEIKLSLRKDVRPAPESAGNN